jgi:hypothetical protein
MGWVRKRGRSAALCLISAAIIAISPGPVAHFLRRTRRFFATFPIYNEIVIKRDV